MALLNVSIEIATVVLFSLFSFGQWTTKYMWGLGYPE